MTDISVFLILGVLILSGLLLGLFASRVGMPRVTVYVGVGVLFSKDLLGAMLDFNLAEVAHVPTAGALGVIAYIIGGSITIEQLQRVGKLIFSSAIGESVGAVLFVFIVLALCLPSIEGMSSFQLALPLAAIAATTAPGATLAVLHQYRARGPMTDALLGVVAVDDALGIIFYSLAFAFATGASLSSNIGWAVWEIGGAVLAGTLFGLFIAKMGHRVRQSGLRLPLVLGGIFFVIGCAEVMRFSPLLASMILGFSARYFMPAAADRLFAPIELLEELVFLVFFTLAGAHFQFAVFTAHIDIILAYFIVRLAGKIIGASMGAYLAGAPRDVARWLGFGLVPQAGVAVGLALTLSQQSAFEVVGPLIINVILGTTVLYELIGPFAVRYALYRTGEMGVKRLSVHE